MRPPERRGVFTPAFVDGEIADADAARHHRRGLCDLPPSLGDAAGRDRAPGHFVLELFHGPTLAFKDVAMQFLARLMDHVLAERGERATIVGATSGDTGGAAIEAFRGRDRDRHLHPVPHGRTSEVQRRQMTTVLDANVHNIAIDGTFDDCQAW
jgi:threonine synthase